jgi:four helix bundle protein
MIYDLRLANRRLRRMTPKELQERTMDFAVRVLKFADALPGTVSGKTVANQIARSGCSVAANYRAALRGKSRADFVNKITIVLEEADETEFWLEVSKRRGLIGEARISGLQLEAIELTKIFNATRTTARNHKS